MPFEGLRHASWACDTLSMVLPLTRFPVRLQGDMALPFLDIKDADAFEPIEPSALDNWAINHNIGLTLLKIKMLLDLRGIHNAAAIGEKVPREILDSVS